MVMLTTKDPGTYAKTVLELNSTERVREHYPSGAFVTQLTFNDWASNIDNARRIFKEKENEILFSGSADQAASSASPEGKQTIQKWIEIWFPEVYITMVIRNFEATKGSKPASGGKDDKTDRDLGPTVMDLLEHEYKNVAAGANFSVMPINSCGGVQSLIVAQKWLCEKSNGIDGVSYLMTSTANKLKRAFRDGFKTSERDFGIFRNEESYQIAMIAAACAESFPVELTNVAAVLKRSKNLSPERLAELFSICQSWKSGELIKDTDFRVSMFNGIKGTMGMNMRFISLLSTIPYQGLTSEFLRKSSQINAYCQRSHFCLFLIQEMLDILDINASNFVVTSAMSCSVLTRVRSYFIATSSEIIDDYGTVSDLFKQWLGFGVTGISTFLTATFRNLGE